jgi:hypothetical protein
MTDPAMASYQRQLDEIGPVHDPRLLLTVDDGTDELHARNLDHLHAYLRARRLHAGDECGAGAICSGPAVSAVIGARNLVTDDAYSTQLLLSAIALLADVTGERDELAARVLRLEMEHDETDARRQQAEAQVLDAFRQVAELTERVATCEAYIATTRAGWPTA